MAPARQGPGHDDPGLQPERTELAWRRTALSLVVAATIFLRWMPHHGWIAGPLVAASTITALAITSSHKRRLHRATHGIIRGVTIPDLASTAALAAAVVVLAALGILIVLFLPLT